MGAPPRAPGARGDSAAAVVLFILVFDPPRRRRRRINPFAQAKPDAKQSSEEPDFFLQLEAYSCEDLGLDAQRILGKDNVNLEYLSLLDLLPFDLKAKFFLVTAHEWGLSKMPVTDSSPVGISEFPGPPEKGGGSARVSLWGDVGGVGRRGGGEVGGGGGGGDGRGGGEGGVEEEESRGWWERWGLGGGVESKPPGKGQGV